MEDGGITLTIGAAALSSITGAAITYWKMKQSQPRKIEPNPLSVELKKALVDTFTTKEEHQALEKRLDLHVEDNARDHENIFARLNANDKLTSKMEGLLEGIRGDLSAIKNKLFKTR